MKKTTIIALVVLFLLIFTAIGFAINKKVKSKQAMEDELAQLKTVKPVVNNYYPVTVENTIETLNQSRVNTAVESYMTDMMTKYNCVKMVADSGELFLTCDVIPQ